MSSLNDTVPDSAIQTAGYLRMASIGIAVWDFLETFPDTYSFYKEQLATPHFMLSTLLFALLQITSIFALVVSNFGFYYDGFTDASCAKFYIIPPCSKVLQSMVSSAVLGVRAFNLSRRSFPILKLLILCYVVAITLEWITTLWKRVPMRDKVHGNCRGASPETIGAWMYYAVAMVYDLIMTSISVFYLLKYQLTSNSSLMTKVVKMMLYDGLGYFTVLTAVNIGNLVIFHIYSDIQTAASSLAYCLTWIMCQRLLIHLHKVSWERRHESIVTSVTVTKDLETSRHIRHALRSQFESKSGMTMELTVPDFEMMESWGGGPEEPEVHVRIEKTVTFADQSDSSTSTGFKELENYSTRRAPHRSYPSRLAQS